MTATDGGLVGDLARAAHADAERAAFVFDDGDQSIRYGELNELSDRFAAGLVSVGVRTGDRVAIWMRNGPEWVVAFYGALKAGATVVPVNTRFRGNEALDIVARSQSRVLVLDDGFKGVSYLGILVEEGGWKGPRRPGDRVPELRAAICRFHNHAGKTAPVGVADYEDVIRSLPLAPHARPAPADTCLIQFTSGTTGFPKGAMLGASAYAYTARAVARAQGLDKARRLLSAGPFFHCSGSLHAIAAGVAAGTTVYHLTLWDPELALRIMDRTRCEVAHAVFLRDFLLMAKADRLRDRRLPLKVAYWTGPPEEMDALREDLGIEGICGIYGLTECSGCAAVGDPEEPYEIRRRSIGKPIAGVEVTLRPPFDGSRLGAGEGEICVRGPNLMQGYYNDPSATASVIDGDGWLRSGDLGRTLPDGSIEFRGRIKDLVRVGGENVAPLEVEAVLSGHPDVLAVTVAGMPDPRLGEVCAAFIIPREGTVLDADDLRRRCAERLADFKVPRYYFLVTSFPMTANNKIRKAELREMALRGELQAL